MKVLERLFVDSKPLVHVLVCVFAVSSWVDINGMWVELPIFVTHLPEEWTLPSYITILSQIANIGPIVFFLLAFLLAKKTSTSSSSSSSAVSKTTLDKATSYVIMLVGFTATLLLAFLWQRTLHVQGVERSVALLALSFFLSVMDCTSSVAYVAFMSALKPAYLASYFVGEGLSGLLPAMMALGQGAGDIVCKNGSSTEEKNVSGIITNVTTYYEYPMYLPPRFSVQVFFLLLSGMIALSIVAFGLLNNLGYCKSEFVTEPAVYQRESSVQESEKNSEANGVSNPACVIDEDTPTEERKPGAGQFSSVPDSSGSPDLGSYGSMETVPRHHHDRAMGGGGEETAVRETEEGEEKGEDMGTGKMLFLLAQVVLINFLITSFLLSVQTYSCLPYGISVYNLVVTLTNIANPVACLISMFLAFRALWAITSLTTLGVACGAYIIVAAVMSPTPPMVGQSAGGPVAVTVWVGASFFLTYAKVSVAGVMRDVGRRALIWYGAATQVGSLIGAVTGFVLVNEVKLFKDASWC